MADRLIYAEDLKHPICMACNHEFSDEPCCGAEHCFIIKAINEAERIDAVEVIRCKHCQHQKTCDHARRLGINGYCSDGERRETS